MLSALALAALRSDSEVRPGALMPGVFSVMCAAMVAHGFVRVEDGAVTITLTGRVADVAEEGER